MIFKKTLFTFPFGLTINSNYGRLCWKFSRLQWIYTKLIQSYWAENLLHYQIEKYHCYFRPYTHNNDADNCFPHTKEKKKLSADPRLVVKRTFLVRSFSPQMSITTIE